MEDNGRDYGLGAEPEAEPEAESAPEPKPGDDAASAMPEGLTKIERKSGTFSARMHTALPDANVPPAEMRWKREHMQKKIPAPTPAPASDAPATEEGGMPAGLTKMERKSRAMKARLCAARVPSR